MPRRYFKRYRMEYDLRRQEPAAAALPAGFEWRDWSQCTLADHALVKFRAFAGTVDAEVFTSLSSYEGCHGLMEHIVGRVDFLPRCTWLLVSTLSETFGPVAVGTTQCVAPVHRQAAIQNVGIVPEFRGQGLGRALVDRTLLAMREEGFERATLEVTSRNEQAVALYHRIGFRTVRTSYRSVRFQQAPRLAIARSS